MVTANASGYATWDDLPASGSGIAPGQVDLDIRSHTSHVGATPTWTLSSAHRRAEYLTTGDNNSGASITWTPYLDAGTYTLEVCYHKGGAYGIVDVTLDGAPAGNFDCYGSIGTTNQFHTSTGLVVAAAGAKPVVLTSSSKNASATGYGFRVSTVSLWRTA